MDTFMDKLAQKMTAQEIIQANAAADAEELNKLQNQVKEYNECLEKMLQVSDEMIRVNQDMVQVNQRMESVSDEMGRMMEETIAPQLDKLVTDTMKPQIQKFVTGTITEDVNRLVEDASLKLQEARVDGSQIDKLVKEAIGKIEQIQQNEKLLEQLKTTLGERFAQSEEYVHKENVKVYRNVQAVILEESGKQNEALNSALKGMKGKINAIVGISIAALVTALGGLVFQLIAFFQRV